MSDLVDNDCDKLTDRIRRPFFVGFWGMINPEWTYGFGTFGNSELVHIPSGGTLRLNGSIPWESGQPNIGMMVRRSLGASCTLLASGLWGVPRGISSTAGAWEWVNVPVDLGDPPYDIVDIDVVCSGGTGMDIDWLTVSNGSYEWPAVPDLDIVYDDTALPGGGQSTVVVRGDAAGGYWAGSDLGGLAWSATGQDWETVNGDANDLISHDELGVWDIYPDAGGTVWAVTGRYEQGSVTDTHGGLFASNDGGATWGEVSFVDPFGIFGAISPCGTHGSQDASARAGGRLIVPWGSGQIIVANHRTPGLRVVDTASGTEFALPASALPATATDQISALATLAVAGAADDTLLVGFKSRDQAGAADALWRCELGTGALSSGGSYTCAAVPGTEWDVRDIEVLENYDTVLVADGGRRFTDSGSTSAANCTIDEPAVYGVQLTASSEVVWNLDDTMDTDPVPAWSNWPTPKDQDQGGSGTLRQILTTQEIGGGELAGIAVDEERTRVLAFFDAAQDTGYTYPRVYYADLAGFAANTTLSWYPYQDFTKTDAQWVQDDDPYGARISTSVSQRNNAVQGGGTWLDDQQSELTWFPAYASDGVFTDSDILLVSSGWAVYSLGAETASAPGWNSDYWTDDLDYLPWTMALLPPSTGAEDEAEVGWQITVTQDLWVCADCGGDGYEESGWQALSDLSLAHFYGPDPAGVSPRERAEVDCHQDTFNASGGAVDGYAAGDGTHVLWAGLVDRSGDETPWRQGLWRRNAAGTWCWEGTTQAKTEPTRKAYLSRDNGNTVDNELRCKWAEAADGAGNEDVAITQPWGACDPTTIPNPGELLGSYGNPYALSVNDDQGAAVAFRTHQDGAGLAEGGLALLLTSSSDQTTLIPLTFSADIRAACPNSDEQDLFLDVPRLEFDPTWGNLTDGDAGDWDVRLYVGFWGGAASDGDDDCGLWIVESTGAGGVETSLTWTSVSLVDDGCTLTRDTLQGIAVADWAPDTVFAFGGYDNVVSTTEGGVCALSTGTSGTLPTLVTDPAKWTFTVRDVAPHPHLANTLLVGSKVKYSDATGYDTPGISTVALRWNAATGVEDWMNAGITSDGLVNPVIEDIEWVDFEGYTNRFYVGTNGSGVLQGDVGW